MPLCINDMVAAYFRQQLNRHPDNEMSMTMKQVLLGLSWSNLAGS